MVLRPPSCLNWSDENGTTCYGSGEIETDFYCSLCAVAGHYNGTKAYGYKDVLAIPTISPFLRMEVDNHLSRNIRNWNCLRLVQDDKGKDLFISEEQYNTGTTLFYIPVIPLYKVPRTRETKNGPIGHYPYLLICIM